MRCTGWLLTCLALARLAPIAGCDPGSGEACDTSEAEDPPAVRGTVYVDTDRSDRSLYQAGHRRGDAYQEDLAVTLLGGVERTFTTCGEGFFAFGAVTPGLHLLHLPLAPDRWTTSRNLPQRLPVAVRAGSVRLVVLGDSLPVYGAEQRFPELLAERLRALAPVELDNRAVEGSTSEDWAPGGTLFEDSRSALASADAVLLSLGGNDVLYFAEDKVQENDIAGLFDGLVPFVATVIERVRALVAAIHEEGPGADVAYLLYPNYGRSARWVEWTGEALQPTVIAKLDEGLELFRDSFPPEDRILLVDLCTAWSEAPSLDAYLVDELHFNPLGHDLVADEFLKALAAVRLDGERPLGAVHAFGLSPLE